MIIDYAETEEDLAAIRALRQSIFVDEQAMLPEEEWDGQDRDSRHLIARDGPNVAGTLRWRTSGRTAKIERLCVADTYRGTGLGERLLIRVLEDLRAIPGIGEIRIHAHSDGQALYEGFGFVAEGEDFDEAGIPHRAMVLKFA